jgi:hypothetical protein
MRATADLENLSPTDAAANTARANPFGMSDAETLECLGPSWAEMCAAERVSYPALPAIGTQRRRHLVRPMRPRIVRRFVSRVSIA